MSIGRIMLMFMWRILTWQSDDKSYFSKTSNMLSEIWDQTSTQGSKHDLMYNRRTTEDSIRFGIQHPILNLLFLSISSMLGITVVIFSMRRMVKYIMPRVMTNKKKKKSGNDSTMIDENEVVLYTIDSIDEFEKISKTETEISEVPNSRQEDMKKKRYESSREDDQDFSYETDLSFSSDPNRSPSHDIKDKDNHQVNKQQVNILSVMATPFASIKTMLSQVTPNFSTETNSNSTTESDKVDVLNDIRQLKNHGKTKQENISKRRVQNKPSTAGNGLRRETKPPAPVSCKPNNKSNTPGKKPLSKMLKHRSMNTEIRTYKMNDGSLKSTTEPDSLTDNETDLETEMFMIDLPANYYYQNKLADMKKPYLMNVKNRMKV